MLAVLRGSPDEVEQANLLRTPELVDRIEDDLARRFRSLLDTQSAADARAWLDQLPRAIERLRQIDDAAWWVRQRRHLPPHDTKRAYEEYPWPFGDALRAELERADQARRLRSYAAVDLAVHEAAAPAVPDELARALRKSRHRRFLVAGDVVVAIYDAGVRFVGSNGKPTAKTVPKGTGQVEGAALADDGSFVLLRNAGGLHRIDLPGKHLRSWPTPARTLASGLCALGGGRFAIVTDAPAISIREFRGGEPVEIAAATHPDLDSYAGLERLGGAADLVFAKTPAADGARLTLTARWDGTAVQWIGRHELPIHAVRRTRDGAIVARVSNHDAIRLTDG